MFQYIIQLLINSRKNSDTFSDYVYKNYFKILTNFLLSFVAMLPNRFFTHLCRSSINIPVLYIIQCIRIFFSKNPLMPYQFFYQFILESYLLSCLVLENCDLLLIIYLDLFLAPSGFLTSALFAPSILNCAIGPP